MVCGIVTRSETGAGQHVSVYAFLRLDNRGQILVEKEGNVLQCSYTGVQSAWVLYCMLAKHLLVPQNGQETSKRHEWL